MIQISERVVVFSLYPDKSPIALENKDSGLKCLIFMINKQHFYDVQATVPPEALQMCFGDLLVIPGCFHVVCVVLHIRVDFDAFFSRLNFQR